STSATPLAFDHIYNKAPSLPGAVLYGDLTSPGFPALHATLKSLADDDRLVYVLRYKPAAHASGSPLILSGYGVELMLKSTEYKVIDDRGLKGRSNASSGIAEGSFDHSSGEDDAAGDDEPREPDDHADETTQESSTDSLDMLFEDGEPSIQSLTADEIREISLKTAHLVLSSREPLSVLARLGQDFPKLAHMIAKTTTSPRVRAGLRKNLLTLATAGQNRLFMNNIELPVDGLDIFSLFRRLRDEARLVDSILGLSLSVPEALRLLAVPPGSFGADLGWGEAFDVRNEQVVWWNDLENDARYRSWPRSLRDILRPMYPGQLRYIRKNLFNLLFALDLTSLQHLDVLNQVFAFLDRDVPLRFGLMPLISGGGDDS
ncbi:hypothetical protein HK405_000929, partial [Cladochytrium tenue]